MGFFSGVERFLTNTKRAVFRGVGKVIEKVGEITNNFDIEIKGMEIQLNNPVLEKKIDLNSAETSVQDTIDVHKACEETRRQAANQAKKYEDKLVDELEEDIAKFIDILAEVFPAEVLSEFNYGIGDSFEDDIHNTISDYFATHISQDSEEYVQILKMEDSVREDKTDEYVKRVLNDAIKTLQKKCSDKKIATYKRMYEDLESYFENEKKLAEEAERNLRELQKHQNDMGYYEEQAIKTVIDLSYMECIKTLTYSNS